MRFILLAIAAADAEGRSGATLAAQVSRAVVHAVTGLAAALPDPMTAAAFSAALGVVVGARRGRAMAVAG